MPSSADKRTTAGVSSRFGSSKLHSSWTRQRSLHSGRLRRLANTNTLMPFTVVLEHKDSEEVPPAVTCWLRHDVIRTSVEMILKLKYCIQPCQMKSRAHDIFKLPSPLWPGDSAGIGHDYRPLPTRPPSGCVAGIMMAGQQVKENPTHVVP